VCGFDVTGTANGEQAECFCQLRQVLTEQGNWLRLDSRTAQTVAALTVRFGGEDRNPLPAARLHNYYGAWLFRRSSAFRGTKVEVRTLPLCRFPLEIWTYPADELAAHIY